MYKMHKTLGQALRAIREERDISIRELAKKVDLSPAFLSDVELGRRHPSVENLTLIAKELKASLENLLELDTRGDTESLRRLATANPAYGFAFRQIVNENISPEELMELLERTKAQRKKK
jgi:transcriptional regulator with XRE-family HTH domain